MVWEPANVQPAGCAHPLLAQDLLELEGGQLQELNGLLEERGHDEPPPLLRDQAHRDPSPHGGTEL